MRTIILSLMLTIALQGCSEFSINQKIENKTKEEVLVSSKYMDQSINFKKYVDVNKRSIENDKELTLVVAISGGGYRAANFGIGALLALEDIRIENRSLLQEVDY